MTSLVPTAPLRRIIDAWVAEFDSPSSAYERLAAATDIQADSWRRRFAANDERSWWAAETIDEQDADTVLTAIERPDMLATLTTAAAPLLCEDCHQPIADGDHRPLDLMRPDTAAREGFLWNATRGKQIRVPSVKAREGGRRFRVVDLCRRCAAEALRQRAARSGSRTVNGKKIVLHTRERVAPRRGGRPRLLDDRELHALHVVYDREQLSMGDLARLLATTRTAGTEGGYYQSILYGWRRLRLELRPKSESQMLAHHRRGRVPRRAARCPATTRNGTQCRLRLKGGSAYCVRHQTLAETAAA